MRDGGVGASPGDKGVAGNGNGRVEPPVLGGSECTDYFLIEDLLADEQRALRQRVREFMEREVIPIINPYWERAEFPHELLPKRGQLGIADFQIPGYGCPGMNNVTAGLVIMELARGDLSISTFMGVHSALAMMSIDLLGSEQQKQQHATLTPPNITSIDHSIDLLSPTGPYRSRSHHRMAISGSRSGSPGRVTRYRTPFRFAARGDRQRAENGDRSVSWGVGRAALAPYARTVYGYRAVADEIRLAT